MIPAIQYQTRKVKEVVHRLKDIPPRAMKAVLRAVGLWLIGEQSRGLKQYQPYKYITRKKAYGKTFVSDRQRRYVMAAIREGRIEPGFPHRTGGTQRAWTYVPKDERHAFIVNQKRSAYFTKHDTGQARLNALAGWKKVAKDIRDNIAGALRAARAKMNEILRSKK